MTADAARLLSGVFAAIPTPILQDGHLDLAMLDRLVAFAIDAGVHGVCLSGATGEYPHFEIAERKTLIRHPASLLPRARTLLVGIGGPSTRHVPDAFGAALDAGSRALLAANADVL